MSAARKYAKAPIVRAFQFKLKISDEWAALALFDFCESDYDKDIVEEVAARAQGGMTVLTMERRPYKRLLKMIEHLTGTVDRIDTIDLYERIKAAKYMEL